MLANFSLKNRILYLAIALMLILSACQPGASATLAPGDAPTPPTGTAPAVSSAGSSGGGLEETPTPNVRWAMLRTMLGMVYLINEVSEETHQARPDEVFTVGSTLTTEAHSEATLGLDDGTGMFVGPESSFRLVEMGGTSEHPLTRFFLNIGEVFLFRLAQPELPEGTDLSVETPNGLSAVRGSAILVRYTPGDTADTGVTTTLCLSGHCTAESTITGEVVALEAGEKIQIDEAGEIGDKEQISPEEIEQGLDALDAVQQAGMQVEAAASEAIQQPTPWPTSTPAATPTVTPTPTITPTATFNPIYHPRVIKMVDCSQTPTLDNSFAVWGGWFDGGAVFPTGHSFWLDMHLVMPNGMTREEAEAMIPRIDLVVTIDGVSIPAWNNTKVVVWEPVIERFMVSSYHCTGMLGYFQEYAVVGSSYQDGVFVESFAFTMVGR
jgi:hypothetical protein